MIRISSVVSPWNREGLHIADDGPHTLPTASGAGGPTYTSMHPHLSPSLFVFLEVDRLFSGYSSSPSHSHHPSPFHVVPFSTISGSRLTYKYVHYCVLVQFLFTLSLCLFLPLFTSLLAIIASIETSTIVTFCSCILHSTARPATEEFDTQPYLVFYGRPFFDSDVWPIGVCAFNITLPCPDDLRLNGCSYNKHARGFENSIQV